MTRGVEVRVLFFAALRDELQMSETTLSLDGDAVVVRDIIASLGHSPLHFLERGVRAAVDEEFTDFDHRLRGGETVAFIPPVSGG